VAAAVPRLKAGCIFVAYGRMHMTIYYIVVLRLTLRLIVWSFILFLPHTNLISHIYYHVLLIIIIYIFKAVNNNRMSALLIHLSGPAHYNMLLFTHRSMKANKNGPPPEITPKSSYEAQLYNTLNEQMFFMYNTHKVMWIKP